MENIDQLAAVMYLTLKSAGGEIERQPVIYTLTEGYGVFLTLRGFGDLVAAIDRKIEQGAWSGITRNPSEVVEWIQEEVCERCRGREHGAIGGIR